MSRAKLPSSAKNKPSKIYIYTLSVNLILRKNKYVK